MTEKANASLVSIAKGTGIVYISNILVMLLGFIGGVIIVRSITQSEYGIYSLAVTIISVLLLVSSLGLGDGLTRCIAYFRGTGEVSEIKSVIISSIQIAAISGVIFTIAAIAISPNISISIFGKQELLMPLRLLAISIPFSVLIEVYNAVFRGFNRALPGAFFSLSRSLIFVLAITACAIFNASINSIIFAFIFSIILACIAFSIYMVKNSPLDTIGIDLKEMTRLHPICIDLLSFSVPLLAVNMLIMVLLWMDTLMLGYFKTPDQVGLYSIAPPLANLNILFLTSLGALYTPIAAKLYGGGRLDDLRKSYALSTKWCYIGSFPLVCIFVLFPDVILNFLYGPKYVAASGVLQILALGVLFNSATGTNFHTLIAIGKSRVITETFLMSSIINIILNLLLIPRIGIAGAAIATAISVATGNLALSVGLYKYLRVHPLTSTYIRSLVLSIIAATPIYIISVSSSRSAILTVIMSFILMILIYAVLILATRTFDDEDIMILHAFRKHIDKNLNLITFYKHASKRIKLKVEL